MRRIIVGALFASILLGGFAQARPNLFDPVEEIGTLTFVDGIFSVNGMELELGSLRVVAEDYNGDGTYNAIWNELWNMRGQRVTVAGYRDHSPNSYDKMYVIFINGKYYPNSKVYGSNSQ